MLCYNYHEKQRMALPSQIVDVSEWLDSIAREAEGLRAAMHNRVGLVKLQYVIDILERTNYHLGKANGHLKSLPDSSLRFMGYSDGVD